MMARKKLNQNGFGSLEIVLLVVLVVLIVGVGYFVYHAQNKANNTLNNASVSTNSVTATKPTNINAVNRVKVAYARYADTTGGQAKQLAAIKTYLTTDLYSKLSAATGGATDPLLCTATAPKTIATKLNTAATTKTATAVTVNETMNDGSKVTPQVTVDLSSLKISAIDCSSATSM